MSQDDDGIDSFDDMDLCDDLLRGIYHRGLERPSFCQSRSIVPCTLGRHVLIQGPSGTGKTSAVLIGMLARINTTSDTIQALVLATGRELSHATSREVTLLGAFLGIRSFCVVGGVPLRQELANLQDNEPHVLVGSLGRINDYVCRQLISLSGIRSLILCDADRMLDSSSTLAQMRMLLQAVQPVEPQVIVETSTHSEEVSALADSFFAHHVSVVEMPLHQLYDAFQADMQVSLNASGTEELSDP